MVDLPVAHSGNPPTDKSAEDLRSGNPPPSWTIPFLGFAPLTKPHARFSLRLREQLYKDGL